MLYTDLDPKLSYVLAVTYANDHVYKRVQSLWANGEQLHEPFAIPKSAAVRLVVKVPQVGDENRQNGLAVPPSRRSKRHRLDRRALGQCPRQADLANLRRLRAVSLREREDSRHDLRTGRRRGRQDIRPGAIQPFVRREERGRRLVHDPEERFEESAAEERFADRGRDRQPFRNA